MQPDPTPPTSLPALLPPTASLLKRTQGALRLLRDVVQESSAEYWYERGRAANAREDWMEACYSFEFCLKLDYNHWRGTLQTALVLAHIQQENRACVLLLKAYEMRYSTYIDFSTELTLQQWYALRKKLESIQEPNENPFENSLAFALELLLLESQAYAM